MKNYEYTSTVDVIAGAQMRYGPTARNWPCPPPIENTDKMVPPAAGVELE